MLYTEKKIYMLDKKSNLKFDVAAIFKAKMQAQNILIIFINLKGCRLKYVLNLRFKGSERT